MRQVCEHGWITSHLILDEDKMNDDERAFVSHDIAISIFEKTLPEVKEDVHRLKESDLTCLVNMHDDHEASYNQRTSSNHSKANKRKNKERKREAGQGQGENTSFGTPPLRSVPSIDSFSSKGSTRSRTSSRKSLHSLKREDSGNLGSTKGSKVRTHTDLCALTPISQLMCILTLLLLLLLLLSIIQLSFYISHDRTKAMVNGTKICLI